MAEQIATLAGGCFWCTEAVFNDVIGVTGVESGYIGGTVTNPTYKQVCGGDTGHAEAVRIRFDPDQIGYGDILDLFFATHDPTQLNRQGNDVGTQYRSAIFPHSAEQESEARSAMERAAADWEKPVVTTIEPLTTWYPAEDYHRDYLAREGNNNPYCMAVIAPKLRKFRKSFAERVKSRALAG
jgi:peptide-methionine (S)-S-oxide reductase